SVSRQGRTILLVSHQIAAVSYLCGQAILLSQGTLAAYGRTEKVIAQYLRESAALSEISLRDRVDRDGTGEVRFVAAALRDRANQPVQSFSCGEDAVLVLSFERLADTVLRNMRVDLGIDNHLGHRVTWLSTELTNEEIAVVPPEAHCVEVR